MDKTSLGDRMKMYEKALSFKTMPLLPVIARLDGRAFHSWTKGLDKPFDKDFVAIMQGTTKELLHLTNATIGYTQSDEITLIFYTDNHDSQIFFDGKIQKMVSVLASMCTAAFKLSLDRQIYEHGGPFGKAGFGDIKTESLFSKPPATFDCRVFQVPTLEEAVNCLIWREQDAVRNSILSLAQSKFSHDEMQNKSCAILQEMLFQEHGVNWGEDLSSELKRGTYYQRIVSERPFTTDEINKLPEKHEAHTNPNLIITRTDIKKTDFPILTKITNRVDVIFNGAEPQLDKNLTEKDADKVEMRDNGEN